MTLDRTSCGRPRRPGRNRGMTLVEAVVSMLIVSTMLVAALTTVGSMARSKMAQAALRKGPALARELLSEILPANYADLYTATPRFGPEPGETRGGTRAAFDDVDDYDGWSETTVQAKDGTPVADLAGWSRRVDVRYVSLTNLDAPVSTDTGLKRITVTVTDPTGRRRSLTALRSSTGVYDHSITRDGTYLNSVGVEIQIGPDSDAGVVSAAHPLNRVVVVEE